MRNYEERAKDFIKQIYPIIKGELGYPWVIKQSINAFNKTNNRKVQVRCGSARCALLTSDYVIKWDYDPDEAEEIGGCENEIYLYDIAKRDGFDYLFAKISRFCYKGHNFYIMPRIYGINNENGRGWQYMTKEEVTWCQNHYLTDLHCNNYGFRKGYICIIDYAFLDNMVTDSSSSSSCHFFS